MTNTIKLYELPNYARYRPKIYGLCPGGDENGWVEFDHIDGAYSYCVAFDGSGSKLGVCHLAAWTSLERFGDGYRVVQNND